MGDRLPILDKLGPNEGKGRTSVARVPNAWYVACLTTELKKKPIARKVLGWPLVLFRDDSGVAHCLVDRCPHRNVPLSLGRVINGELECAYHGWRFNGDGQCTRVPALAPESRLGPGVVSWFVREQQGLIWVYADSPDSPKEEPHFFPLVQEPNYHTLHDIVQASGSLHAVAENALDVPHTAFLHGGLFRQDKARRPIDVVVTRNATQVQAQYIGEETPKGLVGRILAPQGGEIEHYDRFLLPGILQVEYRLGERSHLLISGLLTPIDDFETRLFALATFKLPVPVWLVKPIVRPIAHFIFRQDARILKAQAETIKTFGGEQYAHTEIDALGPHITRLLRAAERGSTATHEQNFEKRFQMYV